VIADDGRALVHVIAYSGAAPPWSTSTACRAPPSPFEPRRLLIPRYPKMMPINMITKVAMVVRSAKAPISSRLASMVPNKVGRAGSHHRAVRASTTAISAVPKSVAARLRAKVPGEGSVRDLERLGAGESSLDLLTRLPYYVGPSSPCVDQILSPISRATKSNGRTISERWNHHTDAFPYTFALLSGVSVASKEAAPASAFCSLLTFYLQNAAFSKWAMLDLNQRPPPCKFHFPGFIPY
jgi:hypothetical protein